MPPILRNPRQYAQPRARPPATGDPVLARRPLGDLPFGGVTSCNGRSTENLIERQTHRATAIMPMNDDAKRCTATAKSTGERCQNPAVSGWDVCRMHGAGSPKNGRAGGAPPKHGRYSAKRRESLQEKIEEYREDPDPAEMWEELALLRAVLQEWLAEVETLDQDTVGVILDLQNSIRRTLDSINKIRTRSALTAAEVQFLQSRVADLFRSYVPEDRRGEAIGELKQITSPEQTPSVS